MTTELAVQEQQPQGAIQELSVQDVLHQVGKIQQVMKEVMHEGEHFGKIPGCGDKPTLLQPGAQKLMLTFRLVPSRQVDIIDLGNGHREVRVITRLSTPDGVYRGEGAGCCTTMEAKYRFRTGPKEFTGQPVPKEYWDLRNTNPAAAQAAIGGPGYATGKNPETGQWEICIQGEKVEHDNPADYWNTVEKMACKRADVHAAISTLAASDIFTQDLEDLKDNGVVGNGQSATHETAKPPVAAPQRKSVASKSVASDPGTDAEKQAELARICTAIAAAGKDIATKDHKTYEFVDAPEDIFDGEALADGICITLSSFPGRNGLVKGKPPAQLSGQSLDITLKKAKGLEAQLQQAA